MPLCHPSSCGLLSFADPFVLLLVLSSRAQPEVLQSRGILSPTARDVVYLSSLGNYRLPKLLVALGNLFGMPNSRSLAWPSCRNVVLDATIRWFVEHDVCNATARTSTTTGENAIYIRESKYVPFPRMHE